MKIIWLALLCSFLVGVDQNAALAKATPAQKAAFRLCDAAQDECSKGNYAKAMRMYQQVLKVVPDDALTYVGIGNVRSSQGDEGGALREYNHAIKLSPKCASAYNARGCLPEKNLAEKQAHLEDFNHAILIRPNYTSAYFNRSIQRHLLGDDKLAVSDLNVAIRLKPTESKYFYTRATFQAKLGKFSESIADSTMVIELKPGYAKAYCRRAIGYRALNNDVAAMKDYDKAISLDPTDSWFYQCRAYAQTENRAAIADFTRSLQIRPDATVYAARGWRRSEQGSLLDAIQDYRKAITLNPKYGEAYRCLGEAEFALNHNKQALENFDRAIALQPTARAFERRGAVRYDVHDFKGAISDLSEAIKIDPASSYYLYSRAYSRDDLRDRVGAIADLNKAIQLSPNYTDAYALRAYCRRLSGDLVGAVADYAVVARLDPNRVVDDITGWIHP
jgi:tetratricopeptide (TPR) repeat protein